jgi:midasin
VQGSQELTLYADVTSITRQCLASHSSHLSRDEQWNVLCWTVEKIFKTAMDCDDLWNDTGKGVGKKRALSELLKLLDTSGLHKHKFEIMKVKGFFFPVLIIISMVEK